jgi:hypothetical protein
MIPLKGSRERFFLFSSSAGESETEEVGQKTKGG